MATPWLTRRTLGRFLVGGLVWSALPRSRSALAAPVVISRYASERPGSVNTWWVGTPGGGLIVVDAQRSYKEASEALDVISRTGKPVRAVLVTHPHPDHVNGLGLYRRALPGVPVIAQAATRDEIRDDTRGYERDSAGVRDGEPVRVPDVVIADSERFTVDGLAIEARQLGPGEAAGLTVYWLPELRTLVSGDVATPGFLPFLVEGRTRGWLGQLDQVRAGYPADTQALPGHGPAGALGAMADQQTAYLTAYRALLREAMLPGSQANSELSPEERGHLAAEMERRYPAEDTTSNLPRDKLLALNLDAVRRELRQASP